MKDPRDVIIEPVVSEKSYALLDQNVYTFKVHPDASKPEIRDAVEAIFGVKVLKVNTLNRKGKRKRNRRTGTFGTRPDTKRAIVTLAEGDSIDLFEAIDTMALRKRKPTSPGRRFQTVSDFSEITKTTPEKSLLAPKHKHRRPQQLRPQDRPPQGRRPQAAVPHHRLQAHQGRRAGQGRRDRVRPEPQLPHPAAALPRRREALHPRPDGREGRRPAAERPGLRDPSRQRPAAALHPRRHHRAQRRAASPAAAARWPAAPASSVQLVAKEGDFATLRLPSTEMRRVPIDCRATVGEVGNAEAELIKIGKAGRNRWKGVRPQTRGVAMNPVDHPHGGGEGKTSGGRHPVSPWGKPEGRTRDKTKPSQKLIVRRRRTRGSRR